MSIKKKVPLSLLMPFFPPMRLTRDQKEDEDFQNSLRQHGILDDLLVRPHPTEKGKFEVVDGNRRLAHAEVIGLEEAPVEIREMTDEEAFTLALVRNIQRSTVQDVAIGNWLQLMQLKFSLTQKQLGEKMNRDQSWVSRRISLIESMPRGIKPDSEFQIRAFRTAPEGVRKGLLEEALETGKLPSGREIERRGKAEMEISEVLELYSPRRYEDEFVEHQLQQLAGLTLSEAKEELWKFKNRQSKPTKRREPITDRRDSTVRLYEQLGRYFPLNLIDIVTKYTNSTNFETLVRYCRRLTERMFEVAPEELKQSVIQEFT